MTPAWPLAAAAGIPPPTAHWRIHSHPPGRRRGRFTAPACTRIGTNENEAGSHVAPLQWLHV